MHDADLIAEQRAGIVRAADVLCYYGDVFTRVHGPHPKGHTHDGHEHNFDHQTLLVAGSLKITARKAGVDMGEKVFTAPCPIVIRADTCHEIEVLEDGTVWICAFAVRDMGDPLYTKGMDPYV
jgi:hypothetical protein